MSGSLINFSLLQSKRSFMKAVLCIQITIVELQRKSSYLYCNNNKNKNNKYFKTKANRNVNKQ